MDEEQKNASSDGAEVTPVSGPVKETQPIAKKPFKKISLPAGLLIILSVFVIFGLWSLLLSPDAAHNRSRLGLGPKIAARVNRSIIKKSTVEELSKAGNVDYGETLDLLINVKKYEEFGRRNNIKLSDKDINSAGVDVYGKSSIHISQNGEVQADKNSFHYYLVLKKAWENAVESQKIGAASGVYYEFQFSRYIGGSLIQPTPQTNNPELIAADKKYAREIAEKSLAIIKEGESSDDELLKELTSDPRLIGANVDNRSIKFTAEMFTKRQYITGGEKVRDTVFKLGKPGVSEIVEAGVDMDEAGNKIEYIPMYFFIIKADNVVPPKGENTVNKGLSSIKVVKYE